MYLHVFVGGWVGDLLCRLGNDIWPQEGSGEMTALLEATGSCEELDRQRLDAFLEAILEDGIVEDAVLSASAEQEQVR